MNTPVASLGWKHCGALLLIAAIVGLPILGYPRAYVDHPIFLYVGDVLARGGTLYVDAWDIKSPGIYSIYALGALFSRYNIATVRLLEVAWEFTTAWLLALIAVRLFASAAMGLLAGATYLLFYFSWTYPYLTQAEGFLNLPVAFAFLFALRGMEGNAHVHWFWAGLGIGVATLFKIPIGLLGIIFLVLARRRTPEPLSSMLLRYSALAAGFGLPLLACGFYLWNRNIVNEFLVAQFIMAPDYVRHMRQASDSLARVTRSVQGLSSWMSCTLAGLCLLSARREFQRAGKMDSEMWTVLAWIAVNIFVIVWAATFFPYHYVPLLAPAAVLAAPSLHALWAERPRHRTILSWVLLGAVLISILISADRFRRNVAYSSSILAGHVPRNTWSELCRYIRDHSAPSERIYVWGGVVEIYVLANRMSASRFLHALYLAVPWQGVDYRDTFLKEMAERRPVYFVLLKSAVSGNQLFDVDMEKAYRNFGPLRAFVDENYFLERESELYYLYRRK